MSELDRQFRELETKILDQARELTQQDLELAKQIVALSQLLNRTIAAVKDLGEQVRAMSGSEGN